MTKLFLFLFIVYNLFSSDRYTIIGNPYTKQYKDGEQIYARNIWDMQVYQGKIYLGAGNSSNIGPASNAGRVFVVSLNPKTNIFNYEYKVAEEQIDLFKVYGDILYVPGHDATQKWNFGNIYRKYEDKWYKNRTLPKALHVYDLIVYNDKIFTAIGLYNKGAVFISNPHAKVWKELPHGKGRVYSLLKVGDELFATKTFKTRYKNKLSVTQYNKDFNTFSARFDLNAFKMFPDTKLRRDSIKLVKSISFKNKAVYLGVYKHNDHQGLPFGAYIASMKHGSLDVKRIKLKNDYIPRDILLRNKYIYILVSKTENNRENIKVLKFKQKNLNKYEEIISFKYNSFARSFEKVNGCFYFGIGSEIKDPNNWKQNELKKETGNILMSCLVRGAF